MEEAKYTALAAKYLSGDINAEERRTLMEWVAQSDANQAFFDEVIQLWTLTGEVDQPFETDTKAAWTKVAGRIGGGGGQVDQPSEARVRRLSNKRYWLRIAAVLLPLLIAGTWWMLQPKASVERLIASTDSMLAVSLPDGSKVTLNANSRLRYPEGFEERRVILEGEAFFDIARDTSRPFEILGGQTITRVLGTSFNLRAYPQEEAVELMVQTGVVEFREREAPSSDGVILTQNEAAVFRKNTDKPEMISSLGSNANAWMKREIDAVDVPLRQVLRIVNNYFRTEIAVEREDMLDCNISIPKLEDPSLDLTLEMITEILGLERDTTTDGKILLRGGEGCN